MKVGDLVRVQLPHMSRTDRPSEVQAVIMGETEVHTMSDDAWVKVFIEGQTKVIHVDYIREVYDGSR